MKAEEKIISHVKSWRVIIGKIYSFVFLFQGKLSVHSEQPSLQDQIALFTSEFSFIVQKRTSS